MEVLKIILKILYYTIDIIILTYFLYYFITGLFVFRKKKGKIRKYKPTKKFAVLIAARNESNVIGHLLDSLNKQNYPKELYDVFVIPKVGYFHFINRPDSLTAEYHRTMTQEEGAWWIKLAGQEYHFKKDRNKTYTPSEEE